LNKETVAVTNAMEQIRAQRRASGEGDNDVPPTIPPPPPASPDGSLELDVGNVSMLGTTETNRLLRNLGRKLQEENDF